MKNTSKKVFYGQNMTFHTVIILRERDVQDIIAKHFPLMKTS